MEYNFKRKRLNEIPEERMLKELEMVAKYFNYIEFSRRNFDKIANISSSVIRKHFGGSWTNALKTLKKNLQNKNLDLSPRPHPYNRFYSDKDLFDEMERIWKKVGQRPSRTEWEISQPKISYPCYKKRFGGWVNACNKFIEYKMGTEILVETFDPANQENQKLQKKNKSISNHENSRDISLSLRIRILNRDNFRCVFCGKSPATDFGTKLHIDHIVPFSKGGKSSFENLQTLCEDCNLGKSDKDKIGKKL